MADDLELVMTLQNGGHPAVIACEKAVQAAILAERERCAQIAETYGEECGWVTAPQEIAALIRRSENDE